MNQNKKHNKEHKRYNRRHDGVTTIQSTPERHKLEESQLMKQWDEFWSKERGLFIINFDGTKTKIG
jgi:hypothetical protein